MGGSWVIGAVLAVIASVSSNLGVNVQKYSFMKNADKPQAQQRSYTQQP
jgi:hypothetical protein